MLRVLLPLLFLAAAAWGQNSGTVDVTAAQLDDAVADVTNNLVEDDPARARLLKLYDSTRAVLLATAQYETARGSYSLARAGAAKEAKAIEAALAERELATSAQTGSLAEASLVDIEQRMQVSKAELDARKTKLVEIQTEINGMSARATAIRSRLTELGKLMPDLQSRLALLPKDVATGSEAQAELWLAQVQSDSARAEKGALDEELLSQPMRQQLLAARQDRAGQDISSLERSLQAMERQAAILRQGKANQALAEAEKQLAGAMGKHELVQQVADKNTVLSASFVERGAAIERTREQELVVGNQADRLESDLKSIEHKLNVLGMSAVVGHILREQQVQLPTERESNKDIARVGAQLANSSVRQIELEDDRRRLLDVHQFVDKLVVGLDEETQQLIRSDLLDLASQQRELIKQGLQLESVYSSALGNLEYNHHKYAQVINKYRKFIGERLLWIPSRDPFSVFRSNGLPTQVGELLDADLWLKELRLLPGELLKRQWLALALVLVMVLAYLGPRIRARIVLRGREVGYVRTDAFSNTALAMILSIIASVTWPLLMWTMSALFDQEIDSDLGLALQAGLLHGAKYFWGLEILRILLMPKGLIAAHFRWPAQRADHVRRRIVILERTLLPAVILVEFAISLYPAEVGGALGALGVTLLLCSMAYFFHHIPQYIQGKMSLLLNKQASSGGSTAARVLRQLLVWLPLATIVAVLLGYVYTAMVLSLLLVKTAAVCALIFLLSELATRWLWMTRRRMVARARAEAAHASADEGEASPEEEALENDPELLSDEGAKLINLLTLLGLIAGILGIWAEVIPALGILDSVQLWHREAIVDGQPVSVPVTLGTLVVAIFIAVLGWIALSRIPGLLEIFLRQKVGVQAASAYAATRVFQYAATTILVVGVLGAVGGNWSQIQWAVAALSVGIGFGLQEIVANFISGLIILFEQPIRVGDTITVGGISGKVTKIRIRATTIRDFDRRELLVPNKEFITQQLLNWSLSDQVTRSTIEVGVAYGSDLDKAMAEIREAAHWHPRVLNDPEPIITFDEFGDNSLLIRVRFFMDQMDKRLVTTSELMLEVNRRLNEQGIVVAFPQRDVHFDTAQPLEIRMVDRGPAQPAAPG